MNTKALIAIGKVVKAFGVRGDVAVFPMTEDVTRFKKLKRVFLGRDESVAVEVPISHVAVEPRGVRIGFTTITDRTSAEQLVGSLLFVEEKNSIRLPKGSFFVHNIVGMNVCDEEGVQLGVIREVLKYPANDVYLIDAHGKELMIPAVKEFIKKIDPEAKTMTVHLIEGMLDEGEQNAD